MLRFLLKEKRSFLLAGADIVVLAGVISFGWDAKRILLFFGVDVALSILSFAVYNVIIQGWDTIPSAMMGSMVVLVPAFFIIRQVVTPPYFDFSIFLTFSALAHASDIKKYLSYDESIARPGFALYIGFLFLMIPVCIVLISILQTIHLPMNLSLVIAYIVARHVTEFKRYKKFLEIEKEEES